MNNIYKRYIKDLEMYYDIKKRYRFLRSEDITGAFNLSKDSMIAFDRFSEIREEIRESSGREGAATKDRLKDMCDFLEEVSTHSRMIWKYCVEGERRAEI